MRKCPLSCPLESMPDSLRPALAAVLLGKGEKATNVWAHSPLPAAPGGRKNVNKTQTQC